MGGRDETTRIALWAGGWIFLGLRMPWLIDTFSQGRLRALLGLPLHGILCQLVTLLAGVGAAFVLFERPADVLGLRRLSVRNAALLVSVVPALFIVDMLLSAAIAMPFLPVHAGHAVEGAARQQAGGFGQAVSETPLPLLLLWVGVTTAVSEELMFRGALFGALQRIVSGWRAGGASKERRDRLANAAAVVMAALVFGALHANWAGAVGVVRVVSATLVGLACGVALLLTGTVVASMLMHFLVNTLSMGLGHSWFDGPSRSPGLPSGLLVLAAMGIACAIPLARRRLIGRGLDPPTKEDEPG